MIPRYTREAMGKIFTDQARLETWLKVELAVCEELAGRGEIPRKALAVIRRKAAVDVARALTIEATVQHDVIAFLTAVAEKVGPESRFIHLGLTSSDILDTALALQMVQACDLLLRGLDDLLEALREQALAYAELPCMGRTHGVHAEPVTLGFKIASWFAEIERGVERTARAREVVRVGKLSGAVGTFTQQPPAVEKAVMRRLGLRPETVATQVVPRDRHADLLCALALVACGLERMATEIRHLQRTEVREVEEPFGRGQKGSSAMPHKRNPIACENVSGLARLVRSNALAALQNVALWHERDISHSSVERVVIPDSFILLDYMLARMTKVVRGLQVYPEAMRENIERSRGLVYSQSLLLALVRAGLSREEAYRVVQENAMAVWSQEKPDLESACLADPRVSGKVPPAAITKAFDPRALLAHARGIVKRAVGKPGKAGKRGRRRG